MFDVKLENIFNITGNNPRPYKIVGYVNGKPVITISRIDHCGLGGIPPFWQLSNSTALPANINEAKEYVECMHQTFQKFEEVKKQYYNE
jgi:hypothetical protein